MLSKSQIGWKKNCVLLSAGFEALKILKYSQMSARLSPEPDDFDGQFLVAKFSQSTWRLSVPFRFSLDFLPAALIPEHELGRSKCCIAAETRRKPQKEVRKERKPEQKEASRRELARASPLLFWKWKQKTSRSLPGRRSLLFYLRSTVLT